MMLQRTHYESVEDIDWTAEQKRWDDNPLMYNLRFQLDGLAFSFSPSLVEKKCVLIMYIDGQWKGEYWNKDHAYYKYNNIKTEKLYKGRQREVFKNALLAKRATKAMKQYAQERLDSTYENATPIYKSVREIKKMVERVMGG